MYQAMEIPKSQCRRASRERGFTLAEVMVAIVILAVGLLGLAALMAQLTGTSGQSRYMGTEVMLASEKLEDLNRLPVGDANLAAGGSLAADNALFFDEIQISADNGGNKANNSEISRTENSAPAATSGDMLVFKRRWVIEQNPAGFPNGVTRITVWVGLISGGTVSQRNTFQTSMVRL